MSEARHNDTAELLGLATARKWVGDRDGAIELLRQAYLLAIACFIQLSPFSGYPCIFIRLEGQTKHGASSKCF